MPPEERRDYLHRSLDERRDQRSFDEILNGLVRALKEGCGLEPEPDDFLDRNESEALTVRFVHEVWRHRSGRREWGEDQRHELERHLATLAETSPDLPILLLLNMSSWPHRRAVRLPSSTALLRDPFRVLDALGGAGYSDLALTTSDLGNGLLLDLVNEWRDQCAYIYELTAWGAFSLPPDGRDT